MSCMENLLGFTAWRRSSPHFTTFRVNTLVSTPDHLMYTLKQSLTELAEVRAQSGRNATLPLIILHPLLPDLVMLGRWHKNCELPRHDNEVIVDPACGAAVLRGAHVFAPGVIGLLPGATNGDIVSIYANIGSKCKRGWTLKLEKNDRYFVGNGILLVDRKQIFGGNAINRGIAVHVTDTESGCPSLPSHLLPSGMGIMQNLPSVVCGHVVDPQPGERILDMCAAPGNKTTHLAALMKNMGSIIALDRSAPRIEKLHQLCKSSGVKNVTAFVFNSINAVRSDGQLCSDVALEENGPPFPASSFDRILLDAPCSGLGQRPKLEPINFKHIASFPPLQRKLFESAVKLLKPGGILVYSTCTLAIEENEAIVRWALDRFPCLQLLPPRSHFSQLLLPDLEFSRSILSPTELECVLKFAPNLSGAIDAHDCEKDTIGFFIARFQKLI